MLRKTLSGPLGGFLYYTVMIAAAVGFTQLVYIYVIGIS